jgi:hypothetical protein
VSGELVVDAPELVKLAAVAADRLETIALSGNTVRVRYRAICELVGVLREQYATGAIMVRDFRTNFTIKATSFSPELTSH